MKCLVTSSRAVQKNERGFCHYYSDKNVVLVQWNDNRVVYMASNFVDVQPIKAVKLFSQRRKKETDAPLPHCFIRYNQGSE